MPIARVQMPDGGIARLDVPEGTTPQQIEAFVFEQYHGKPKATPTAFEADAARAEKPSALARVGRGFADVTEGLKQGALMAGGDDAGAYTKARTEELNAYERGRGKDAGVDWMRLGGNVAATLPTMAIPGGGASSIVTRILSGAGQGAVASGSMFTPEGESKAGQIATGAAFGGAVPVAARAVKSAGGAVFDRLMGTPATGNVTGELTMKLQQQGIDFGKLTADVRQSLVADAERALAAGGTLDDAMLANKALIESVGAKPTRASVTRNPKDWQTEKNLRGVTGVGEPIATREAANATALTDYLGRLKAQTGARAGTPLEAGESTISALKASDATTKAGVDTAYAKARDHLGRAAPMDANSFSTAANLALDEGMLGHYLPGEVRNILNDVTAGKIPFNVNTAVQIDSTLAAAQRSAGARSPQALAIGKVRDALNAAGIADNVGVEAKGAFDTARGLAKDRFKTIEGAPGLQAAIDDVSPDRFVKKFILDADARDLRATLGQLKGPEGKQAVADIKGHLFDTLMLKATGATSLDDVAGKPFSGRNFSKALDGIAPEKLHLLFSPNELESLRTLQKASKLLTEEVPYSDVNHSKTAAALANLLAKIGSTPIIGKLIAPIIGTGKIGADWVKNANERKAVAEALLGSAGKAGQKVAPLPGMERLLPAPAAAVLNQSSQRPNE